MFVKGPAPIDSKRIVLIAPRQSDDGEWSQHRPRNQGLCFVRGFQSRSSPGKRGVTQDVAKRFAKDDGQGSDGGGTDDSRNSTPIKTRRA